MRFARELQRLVGGTVLGCLRLRRQQHGAAPGRDRLVDQIVTLANRQRVERALPIPRAALQVEQRLDGPGKPRVELERPLGELARRLPLALALSLQKEAAQS